MHCLPGHPEPSINRSVNCTFSSVSHTHTHMHTHKGSACLLRAFVSDCWPERHSSHFLQVTHTGLCVCVCACGVGGGILGFLFFGGDVKILPGYLICILMLNNILTIPTKRTLCLGLEVRWQEMVFVTPPSHTRKETKYGQDGDCLIRSVPS